MVTNSSADEGWMPTTLSSCFFFTPIFTATAKPCMQVAITAMTVSARDQKMLRLLGALHVCMRLLMCVWDDGLMSAKRSNYTALIGQ